ncbi:hypothetical protein FHT08_003047 [Xanthomonas campestris]|uniref:Uncharacterized protein n=1 Tax=Xanthomonas arboricola TaxID=56448 RepID=A0A2S7AA16_9XANT|nr:MULTISPECIES: hypothetical protein [Xanthomonas]MBB5737076.1 hypothetical protein [Xanthomonas sp. CFBP 8152]NIJ77927.1 hypothetical protein [Xanthomonas sp. CFBP 8151]PPT79181.1 hypothetical protein XarbCFBP8152_10520 [Xanthomonas arboricola]PPU05849.1 hypothetical protein XarjCFBP7645_14665 [Xanthomonas arboricola]
MRFPFLLSCMLLLAACGKSPQTFHFDNPTGQPLALQVDGKAHRIPAHAELALELAPGAHTLQSAQLGRVPFIVYADHDGALVNPTLSDYYLVDEVYWTDRAQAVEFKGDAKVQVQGVELTGRYGQVDDLFIAKDWDFDVHTPFPETASGQVDGSGGRRFRKIFAEDAFVAYFESTRGEPGYVAARRPADWHAPARTPTPDAARLPPLAPVFEAHAGPLRKLVDDYLHATDPAEQRRLRKLYVRTQIDFTHATASLGSRLPVIENKRLNDFVGGVSRIMSSAALVPSR